jgi:hypothetical protein
MSARDLEDEFVRCLGARVVQEILAAHGKLGSFRTYQKQPAHRARTIEEQLRGFLNNWKIQLAAPLVEALDLSRAPHPARRRAHPRLTRKRFYPRTEE